MLFVFSFFQYSYASIEQQTEQAPYVLLKFDISEEGKPINIVALESNTTKMIEEYAVKVLSKWKYKPKIVDGKAVLQKDLKVQLDMILEDDA